MNLEWSQLTADERREYRFQRWLNPEHVTFHNPETQELYRQRVQRFIDAITLKEPDRVPVVASAGHVPAAYAGYTIREVMYDPVKLTEAWRKYIHDFEHDCLPGAGTVRCGKALDLTRSKMYKWAGNGLPDDHAAQYLEGEYMKADEWEAFMNDAGDFNLRTYLPRIYGAAEPLAKLPPLRTMGRMPGSLTAWADPQIQAALAALGAAGEAEAAWRKVITSIGQEGMAAGIPYFSAGFVPGGAPLDNVGASLRGTKGTVMDMFKQPQRLIDYMEKTVPESIRGAKAVADITGNPIIFMPLHRGADGWMSEKQFLTFYWPYLRRVVIGQIEEGLVPVLFAEGAYNSRLDIIKDLPKGKVVWHFDQTDIFKAKQVVGDSACLMGNVPASLLATASAEQVKQHCRGLIEGVGRDGGFILAPGAASDHARVENLCAMLAASKAYGRYR